MARGGLFTIHREHPARAEVTPLAAKVLAAVLEKLRLASAQNRRGRLAVVRTLTERGGA